MVYYAITEKGLDRVERGLPRWPSNYFLTLGAVADLEDKYGGARALSETEIQSLVGGDKVIYLALRSLARNGLIEIVQRGDQRFNWMER